MPNQQASTPAKSQPVLCLRDITASCAESGQRCNLYRSQARSSVAEAWSQSRLSMGRRRDLPDLLLQPSQPSQSSQADAATSHTEARVDPAQSQTHADPRWHILTLRGERSSSLSRDSESLQLSRSMSWIEYSGLFPYLQRSVLQFSPGKDPLGPAAFETCNLDERQISGLPITADFSMCFTYRMPVRPKGHALGLLALDLPYGVQRRLPKFCMDAMAAVPDVQLVPAPFYQVRVPGRMQVTISPPADM